eukprot:COSAG06_NODE_247_length_19150_cov_18.943100_5_plen_339_part_00
MLLGPRLLEAAIDHVWAHAPAPLRREDRCTWEAPHRLWAASTHPKYVAQPTFLSPDGPSYRLYEGNDSALALKLLPRHPAVAAIAAALLGEAPRPPRKIRGFYSIFSSSSSMATAAGAARGAGHQFATQQDAAAVAADKAQQVGSSMHVDGAASQLSACVYLSDVRAGGGGLTVLAGSHLPLGAEFTSEFNYEPKPSSFASKLASLTASAAAAAAAAASASSDKQGQASMVEVVAPAGSVIFFHARLAHAAGVNTLPGTARMACFCDFQKDRPIIDVPPVDGTSFRLLREEEPGWRPGQVHARSQHWVDTREMIEDRPPPAGDDLWSNWGPVPDETSD